MKKRVLGLDIGIASIGWALVEFNDDFEEQNGNPGKIIKAGVRIFTKAETPKERESLAKPRRDARSQRRRISRRAARLREIRELLIKKNIVTKESIDITSKNNIYMTINQISTPWQLRMEALDRKLTNEELAVVLTHMAKHRGYKSLRKSEERSDENGAMLKQIAENRKRLMEFKYRTLGEMFCKDELYKEHKRNKGGEYINSFARELIIDETKQIFSAQKNFGNQIADVDLENRYIEIAFTQKSAGTVDKMVGFCSFEPGKKRAPRDSYSAEMFKVLSNINNTVLTDIKTEQSRVFSREEREKILNMVKSSKSGVKYKKIRKELNLGEDIYFNGLDYRNKGDEAVFAVMKGYQELKKAIESVSLEEWESLKDRHDTLDTIVEKIATLKDDILIKEALSELKLDGQVIESLLNLEFKKFINLSFEALRKIRPFQLEGQKYINACESAGYSHKNSEHRNKFLRVPADEEKIHVPVVARAFAQTRKVVNAVIREFGEFDQINIEVANELKNSLADRNRITKGQNDFRNQKEKIMEEIRDQLGVENFSDNLILKYRLWKEQDERCVYSGKKIGINKLLDTGFVDIDHIIPYSKSMDDSYANKVLCLAEENRNKKEDIPFEYFKRTGKDWDSFEVFVNSMKNMRFAKKRKLLKKEFKDIEGFIERNINDTRYATRYIKNFLEENLLFKENKKIKNKVQARSGGLISVLRHNWGVSKNREESHLHHAKDAIVIACATQGMVHYISLISGQYEKDKFKFEKIKNITKNRIPKPWDTFTEDVEKAAGKIFVSFAPRHNVTGAAHKDTIYSKKPLEKGLDYVTVKTPLENIKLKHLELIPCNQNCGLVEVLRERLEKYGDDPKKAFAEPVFMPCKTPGKQGPRIRSVKIKEKNKSGIEVRKGLAARGEMVRVDVFTKDKKYYLVPIYVSDFKRKEIPNKAVAANKPESDWVNIDESYNFKFSLFKDDLIRVKDSKNKEYFGYFSGMDRTTGAIDIESPIKKILLGRSIGGRSLKEFKKYQVDVLGNYNEVKKEKRMPAYYNTKKDKKD